MKTIKTLSLGLLLTGIMACAQKNETPKSVTDAFTKKFPNAKSVNWDKESDTEWEAEFNMDNTKYSANFASNGTWKETEYAVKMSEVPETIKSSLMTAYPDYKVKESEISETLEGMIYEFEIKKGDSTMEIAIDKNGKIIKKQEKKDDEKDENDDND